MEKNGVFNNPWGAGHSYTPAKMFWEELPIVKDKLYEMRLSSEGSIKNGLVPSMSLVSWGYEYTAATGGNAATGIADMSQEPGWKQWGEWVTARKDKYVALDWDGKVYFPGAGYITPLMPLDQEDWPEGITDATYGDWVGVKLGKLANHIHCSGLFAADFWVGLYGGHHDFHPRVIDAFAKWANVTIPAGTVRERADYIIKNHMPLMFDFRADRFARFYARLAETIRSSGNEPLVGGQMLPDAALTRHYGNDFRIYLQHLPAKNWYFQLELQSDGSRQIQSYFKSAISMGTYSSREPDMQLGAQMDATTNEFWDAVKNAKYTEAEGWLHLKHQWLTVGFTHVLNRDGSVRRAVSAFQRSYWDAGTVDSNWMKILYDHIPRHPFGPAVYYSSDLERQSENSGNPNFYWWVNAKSLGWTEKGIPMGYYAADVALDKITTANKPTGWLVYVDNLNQTKFKDAEKNKLLAIAPIIDETNFKESTPIYFEGDSLGGYSFVDQQGRVVIVVSNRGFKEVKGNMVIHLVKPGNYTMKELFSKSTQTLRIPSSGLSVPITIAGRETQVFEIPGLCLADRACPEPSPLKATAKPLSSQTPHSSFDLLGRNVTKP